VETGFRKVEKDKYEPRLLHVKGRRNIRVQQVMEEKKDGDGYVIFCVINNNVIFPPPSLSLSVPPPSPSSLLADATCLELHQQWRCVPVGHGTDHLRLERFPGRAAGKNQGTGCSKEDTR